MLVTVSPILVNIGMTSSAIVSGYFLLEGSLAKISKNPIKPVIMLLFFRTRTRFFQYYVLSNFNFLL